MNKSFLFFFSLTCYVLCLGFLDKFYFKHNHHFSLRHLYSTLSKEEPWDPSRCSVLSSEEIDALFSQPFFYLDKGHQSFAFESQDKQYIIKFYRFPYHLCRFPWLDHPLTRSSPRRQQIEKYNLQKLENTLNSYSIAFEQLREESALLMVHLHKTRGLSKKIILVDLLKHSYEIPLDATHFVVQKKGELIFSVLQKHIDQGQPEKAKLMIAEICSLVSRLSQKGIKDTDAILEKNYGWMEEKAFLLDIGCLSADPSVQDPLVFKQILLHVTEPLKKWLSLYHSSLLLYYQERTERI